ncbi:nuclear receptor subfamily 1 group I member 3 isoform X2 [Ascaphus truei]|uniref:nuclear receptor subfamily 1 group I member 3 isoform X2 n=1 Tax=Ascaphus truei TaxID=8439 RepID=UPI003F59312D
MTPKQRIRRSITKGFRFTCPFVRTCPINKVKRRQCQACRLQKCLDVGMRKDMIMSEDALVTRRVLRTKRKHDRAQKVQQVVEVGSLTEEDEQLISILMDAQKKNFDSSFSKFVEYRPPLRIQKFYWKNSSVPSPQSTSSPGSLSPPLENVLPVDMEPSAKGDQLVDNVLPSDICMVPHFADLSTFMIKQVIKFAKEIPTFQALPTDDQISLLKGATMEVCQIQFNTIFNLETNLWECGELKYSIQDGAMSGFQQLYLEPLLKFHITLRKLKLHEAEYVLMQAISLFSPDRSGVIAHNVIDGIQEKVALTLKCYIDQRHPLPDGRFLYAKLLSLLTELRTLNDENTRQLLHIQDMSSNAMTPLMKELFC